MLPFDIKINLVLGPLLLDIQIILHMTEFIPQFHKVLFEIDDVPEIIDQIDDHLFDQREFLFIIGIDHIQCIQDEMRTDLLTDIFHLDILLTESGFIQIEFQLIDLIHHLIQTVTQQIEFIRRSGIPFLQPVLDLSVTIPVHSIDQRHDGS